MTCNDMNSKMADLLFEPETVIAGEDALTQEGIRSHLAECDECRKQLEELRATMALLDTWEAPEPNPYFLTRLNARLDEERGAVPAGWPMSWFSRLRARVVYGSRIGLRPVAAMALTVIVLVGGGTYLGLNNWEQPVVQPTQAAIVNDLQTLDSNAQLLDQLESMSNQNDD
jgi:hypothetical protein